MRANCCICSDMFDEIQPISTAPCGHVFHTNCLMLWIGQCKTCPICRLKINHDKVVKLYFNFLTTNTIGNSSILENEISSLKTEISAKKLELEECKKEKENIRLFVKVAEKRASDLQQIVYKYDSEIADLRLKVKSAARLESRVAKLEMMNTSLTNDLQLLNNVQNVVNGSQKDVDSILQECGNGSESSKQMATYCSVLKRELQKMIDSKNKLLELNTKLKQENCRYAAKVKSLEKELEKASKREIFLDKSVDSSFKIKTSTPLSNLQEASTSKVSNNKVDFTSPLTVKFNTLKFNMHIVERSKVPSKINEDKHKNSDLPPFNINKIRDENSVVKTGYNGFGGHTNFINPSGVKKIRSLKRKL